MPVKAITSKVKKISINDNTNPGVINTLFFKLLNVKAASIYAKIEKYIYGKKILDIGTGVGGIAAFLVKKGYEVKSVDVDDVSCFKEFPTKVYDGKNMPYEDNSFDTALIIHVLHHCEDRIQVLREALRTSKRVIFIEDTYINRFEWLVVSLNDMLGNNEFYSHKYGTLKEWREIIKKEGCKIIAEETYVDFTYYILYGRYVLLVIEKN